MGLFYRNIRARDQLDIFLVSAITSLLAVRFYLELTNYPQLGGDSLHIAHMLWGGLFMMAGLIVGLSFLGTRAQQLSALLGGVGFGVFIDELGKFITSDNNYFFRPTIGIIYAIFIVLYLLFNFLTKEQKLSSREYQLNALVQLEEAVANDMDPAEKRQVYKLLAKADNKSSLTIELKKFLDNIEVSAKRRRGRLQLLPKKIDKAYANFWQQKRSNVLVQIIFIAQAVGLFLSVLFTTFININDISFLLDTDVSYGEELIYGQLVSSIASIGFLLYGLVKLRYSRLLAFENFRRSALINIYLTQFFVFSRVQFDALPGFAINLLILILLGFVIHEERRLAK